MRSARISIRNRRRLKVRLPCGASFTLDVSAGGFCTEAMRVLPKGSAVRGTIECHGKSVEFAGRVAWNTPSDLALNVRGRMGVAFVNARPELLAVVVGGSQPAPAGIL
jgi:PilZ domain